MYKFGVVGLKIAVHTSGHTMYDPVTQHVFCNVMIGSGVDALA
jgi:hypothetical protein